MHRVVITGMGMSTSLGPDLRTCWPRLLAGDSGIAPLSFWDPSEYHTKVVAEVKHVPRDTGSDSIPGVWCRRGVRLFLPVAREALADAKLDRTGEGCLPPADIGIAVGASVNYLDMSLMKHYFELRHPDRPALDMARFAREGRQPDNSFYRRLGDMIASVPAKLLKLAGPAFVMDTACAASSHAIGEAFRLVRLGKVKAMLAGGAAALVSPLPILAFSLLGALSRNANPQQASRPFDRQRDGFVMGEGGGAVILESLENAQARGAHIYAELAGYGSSLNAHTLTDPSPDGGAEARAITIALHQASRGRGLYRRPRHLHSQERSHRDRGHQTRVWLAFQAFNGILEQGPNRSYHFRGGCLQCDLCSKGNRRGPRTAHHEFKVARSTV